MNEQINKEIYKPSHVVVTLTFKPVIRVTLTLTVIICKHETSVPEVKGQCAVAMFVLSPGPWGRQ